MIPTRSRTARTSFGHHVVHRTVRRKVVILLRDAVPREPARALEAVDLLEHRALGLQVS
jgi:hypothetical protein